MRSACFALFLWSLLGCVPTMTVPESRPDRRVPDGDVNPGTPRQEARVEYADWMNIGGTDGEHPSGIARHIRGKGIRATIVDRAELTREVLGEGAKLGVWMPFGVNRDKYGGKLRFYYENIVDESWDSELVAGIRLARQRYGIEVVPYLGKISLATEEEFARAGRMLAAGGCKTVILDNLSDTSDRAAPGRVRMLRDRYGIESVGSEFPEKQPTMSDFGFAVDMPPMPGRGTPRGASQAKQNGAMASDQPLAIVLQIGWPEGMVARAAYWKSVKSDLTLYANLANAESREAIKALKR